MSTQIDLYKELQQKKLVIQTFLVFKDLPNEAPIDLTTSIKRFIILRNEKPTVKPIYKFFLNLSLDVVTKINKSKNWHLETKIYFNKNSDKAFTDTSMSPIKYLVRDLKLKPFVYPESRNNQNTAEDSTPLEFFIEAFEEKHLKTTAKSAEARLSNATVQYAIMYLLQQYKDDLGITKLVMNGIDNKETYNEIQIASGGFFKALINLDEKYGIFKTGAEFFIENGVFYCVDKDKINTYTTENLNHTNDLFVDFSTNYDKLNNDNPKDRFVTYPGNYQIVNNTDHIVRNFGSAINYSEDDFRKLIKAPQLIEKTQDKLNINTEIIGSVTNFFSTKVHNIFTKDRMDKLIKPNVKLKCLFQSCNPIDHNFNTQYRITFNVEEDKRYNGTWTMEMGALICEFDEEGKFTANYDCRLKKIYD